MHALVRLGAEASDVAVFDALAAFLIVLIVLTASIALTVFDVITAFDVITVTVVGEGKRFCEKFSYIMEKSVPASLIAGAFPFLGS